MLNYSEQEAWSKTPYQIIKLFEYYREYNPSQFENTQFGRGVKHQIDDIDKALGGL